MSVGFVGSHPPCAFSFVLPYPAPSIQEGSLIPTLRWEPHCHLCLPLSHSVSHFSVLPQLQRSVLWASLPHYSTPLTHFCFTLNCGWSPAHPYCEEAPCALSQLGQRVSSFKPSACLPILFVPSPSGEPPRVPKSYRLRDPRGPKASNWRSHKSGLATYVGPYVSLPSPTTGILLSTSGAILTAPCPTRRTPPHSPMPTAGYLWGSTMHSLTCRRSLLHPTPPAPRGVASADAPSHPRSHARGSHHVPR